MQHWKAAMAKAKARLYIHTHRKKDLYSKPLQKVAEAKSREAEAEAAAVMAKMKVMSSAVALTMVMMMMLASSIDDAEAKVIVVGGEQRWHYGFNYSQWASSLAPVYVGDILEFKFDKPGVNTTAHNVYVFKNKLAYKACDIKQATELSSPDKGAGPKGYRFVLRKAHAYFFACGIGQGFHCQDGLMKFGVSVLPLPKPAHHTSSITISN